MQFPLFIQRKDNMREMIEQAVIARYKKGIDEISHHGVGFGKWKNPDGSPGPGRYAYMFMLASENALRDGKITIEEYVSRLSDEQLLEAFDSQSCLMYR